MSPKPSSAESDFSLISLSILSIVPMIDIFEVLEVKRHKYYLLPRCFIGGCGRLSSYRKKNSMEKIKEKKF